MLVRLTSTQRALLTGVTAAGLLIGAFAAGAAQGGGPRVPRSPSPVPAPCPAPRIG